MVAVTNSGLAYQQISFKKFIICNQRKLGISITHPKLNSARFESFVAREQKYNQESAPQTKKLADL
jgi:hypothetical protein